AQRGGPYYPYYYGPSYYGHYGEPRPAPGLRLLRTLQLATPALLGRLWLAGSQRQDLLLSRDHLPVSAKCSPHDRPATTGCRTSARCGADASAMRRCCTPST